MRDSETTAATPAGTVMTVLGPVPAAEFGFTSMHDHVLWDGRGYRRRWEKQLPTDGLVKPDDPVTLENIGLLQHDMNLSWDAVTMRDREVMTGELREYREAGGRSLVEMSAIGLRCDIEGVREASRASGVHIVATTGFYTGDFWPQEYRGWSIQRYEDHMLREVAEGIEGTDVRAGHVKIAVLDLTRDEENALRAAARVAAKTGLSLTVHPSFGIGGGHDRIARIILEEDLAPERVVLAHSQAFIMGSEHFATLVTQPQLGDLRFDYLDALLEQGFNLSVECFGHTWAVETTGWVLETDWQRLATVVHLVRAMGSTQVVLGNDVYLKILTRRFGGAGYCRLPGFVAPFLRTLGVSAYDVRRMTVENPARILAAPRPDKRSVRREGEGEGPQQKSSGPATGPAAPQRGE
jgi:phosphotriesterase-related protein